METVQPLGPEHRDSPRFDVSQSVYLPAAECTAKNVSAQGIYFVSPLQHRVGALLQVTIAYMQNGERHELQFEGEVVRLEARDEGTGVAARLLSPFFGEVVEAAT